MNKVEERQKKIKDIIGVVESISTEDLAERMNVTGATIRKDLRDMEGRYEIIRNRGRVSLARKLIVDRDINEKIFINADKKKKYRKGGGFPDNPGGLDYDDFRFNYRCICAPSGG